MGLDPRVQSLLSRYEELREQGRSVDLKELCRDHPDLLDELRRQIAALDKMGWMDEAAQSQSTAGGGPPASAVSGGLGGTEGATRFLRAVRESRLLASAQLQEVERLLSSPGADFRTVARSLIERSWLTPYQVNQLAQGRGHNLLLGPYVLLERLGEGGMGQVFKAHHQVMKRVVALKVIHKELLTRQDAVLRFQREVQAAARLSHPNVVTAFDANEAGGTHYFAMEHVEGTDLDRLVRQGGPLPVQQACEYVRQAALGLQHAFERGLVHRDVKPSNLMLESATGLVKILDLGLARLRTPEGVDRALTLTRLGSAMGSPAYMAPEQADDSHHVDIRADIYSLGCTLYYLLTGQTPFQAASLHELLRMHQQEEPVLLVKLRSGVPAGVESVVRKMMAKRTTDRYQTPAEVAQALVQFTQVAPVDPSRTVQSAKPAEDLRSSQHFRRVRWPLWGGIVVLAITLATVGWYFLGRPEHSAEENRRLEGHTGLVQVVIFSPDGRRLLSSGEDKTVRLWDVATGKELRRFEGHQGPIRRLGFSPDGQWALSYSDDQTVRGWDVERGGEIYQTRLRKLSSLVFLPNGRHVLFDGRAEYTYMEPGAYFLHLEQRDVESGRLVAEITYHRINGGTKWFASTCAGVSGDGRWVLFGGPGFIRPWDVEKKCPGRDLSGPMGRVWGVALSSDGRRAVSANEDRSIRLWDVEKGTEVRTLRGHTAEPRAVALSFDGTRALSGGDDHTVRLWDVETGTTLHISEGHEGAIQTVAFSPDGRYAVSGGTNKSLRLWRLPR